MRFFSFLAAAISLAVLVPDASAATCSNPRVRKEWRNLSKKEQAAYIASVQCLMHKTGNGQSYFPAIQSRFDDHAAMHINATQGLLECTGGIHLVGQLFPWHRYAVWTYESALVNECKYPYAQPYWDWTLDYANFSGSPVFDPIWGFGGNGQYQLITTGTTTNPYLAGGTGGGCVQSGWFSSNSTVHISAGKDIQPDVRCLKRNFNPTQAATTLNPGNIASGQNANSFYWFNEFLNPSDKTSQLSTAHTGGHQSTGQDMGDQYSSSLDPLFWLHHARLDKIWYDWQSKNTTTRLKDIAGPTVACTPLGNTTLTDPLYMGFNAPTQPISAVMDTQNRDGSGILCYKYE